MRFVLQLNQKSFEGTRSKERNTQFEYINKNQGISKKQSTRYFYRTLKKRTGW